MATTATFTGAQFDALPYDEGRLWELVNGELIPIPRTTLKHQRIVGNIFLALTLHMRANPGQGEAVTDVEFALDENYRVRPDIFILLPERAASIDPQKVPVPGAPDIAIEVISPSERAFDSQQKVNAYLHYGCREVWQVYPKLNTVVIHRGPNSSTLDCGQRIATPLLPGFALPVESLFD